ncbi:MAG: hypothetical protein GWN62_30720, partial [Aliifodinibius sp.]|nr:hypothetical protein [Fodinibius sp.]
IKAQLENEELRELNAQLRELNEMKDKFISITNHEIRTPLTIIKGYLEILETSIDSSAQELTEIIDIMKRTTLELTNTANRMHILSHARRNNWSSVYKQIELTSLVKNIYRDMRRLFEHRAIDFQIDLPSTATYVNGVPLALKMVIIELLHNALKFTPDRGEVTLSVSQHRKRVFIEVSDTGIGIPYEKQELVFANFYEIQDTVNHKSSREEFMGGGMGIGLSLVKEILTNLNGKIVLISDPGNGTTFKVSLPNPVKFKEESELADLHPYKC